MQYKMKGYTTTNKRHYPKYNIFYFLLGNNKIIKNYQKIKNKKYNSKYLCSENNQLKSLIHKNTKI